MRTVKTEVRKAEKMDLLTYLRLFEPHELAESGKGEYSLKDLEGLKISGGRWSWKKQGIRNEKSALAFLLKVKGLPLRKALRLLSTPICP